LTITPPRNVRADDTTEIRPIGSFVEGPTGYRSQRAPIWFLTMLPQTAPLSSWFSHWPFPGVRSRFAAELRFSIVGYAHAIEKRVAIGESGKATRSNRWDATLLARGHAIRNAIIPTRSEPLFNHTSVCWAVAHVRIAESAALRGGQRIGCITTIPGVVIAAAAAVVVVVAAAGKNQTGAKG
jgi:hypothetical protein